jgi:hypothetical protein
MAAVGASAEAQLAVTLDRLMRGELGLPDLTNSLQGFYNTGWNDGFNAARAACEDEMNRLYRLAFDTPRAQRDRIDASLAAELGLSA